MILTEESTVVTRLVTVGGERLDKWLVGQLLEHSRAEIQRWIADDLVTTRRTSRPRRARRVGGRRGGDGRHCRPPEVVRRSRPEAIPLAIVVEDD